MFGSSFPSSLPSTATAAGGKKNNPDPVEFRTGGFGDASTAGATKNSAYGSCASKIPSLSASSDSHGHGGITFMGDKTRTAPTAIPPSSSSALADAFPAPTITSRFGASAFSAAVAAVSSSASNSKKLSTTASGALSSKVSSSVELPFRGFGDGGIVDGSFLLSSGNERRVHERSSSVGAGACLKQRREETSGGTANSKSSFHSVNRNAYESVENSCMSPDGRSFHSYLYDISTGKHVIVSELAPFDCASSLSGDGNPGNGLDQSSISSLKITTALSCSVVESIDIDPVVGLICVDGGDDRGAKGRQRPQQGEDGKNSMLALPWLCLYTRRSAFLLSIGYHKSDENDDQEKGIEGRIMHVLEPFEKQLLMAPRGSAILRIRTAPSSDSMFQRCGSMAMLMREGDVADNGAVAHALVLYHGLPEEFWGKDNFRADTQGRGKDFGGMNNPLSLGCVTMPLRFTREDMVRGMEDTIDAENEAYGISSLHEGSPSSLPCPSSSVKCVVDFCFMNFPPSNPGKSTGFSATTALILGSDGSVYSASPIVFDGTVVPRSVMVKTISHLNAEIEASTALLNSSAPSPTPTLEQERLEARIRQCRAARRYFSDAFGIPDCPMPLVAVTGSYYVSASVVHSRVKSSLESRIPSQVMTWQTRLQGPLLISMQSDPTMPCSCIEPFGGTTGAGIIHGFVVLRECQADRSTQSRSKLPPPIHVEFGFLPGKGSVILPRFEFESDSDCRTINGLIGGAGAYIERISIMNDEGSSQGEEDEQSRNKTPPRSRTTAASNATSIDSRRCSIIVDPLDDLMVHVVARARIATVTTNALVVTVNRFKSSPGSTAACPQKGGEEGKAEMRVRTKVWSSLEASSGDTELVGAGVSSDVHMGHILLARVLKGSMEVVNMTSTQCLHEAVEQMNQKLERLDACTDDNKSMEALKQVKPLCELMQPLIDRVCDGFSKMGKIVGGDTVPRDAGPEDLAIFLETQRSCEENVLAPLEEASRILIMRRALLKEMRDHQAEELTRLSVLLIEIKQMHDSNLRCVLELESESKVLAERSSAVLTATRELRPRVTEAEAAYFKDLRRFETSCSKWEAVVGQIRRGTAASCNTVSAGVDFQCLVDLPTCKAEICHNLLRGEAQLLKKINQRVMQIESQMEAVVERMSGVLSIMDSEDAACLCKSGDKENQMR